MKATFSLTCKWAVLLSATMSLSAWSADAIYAKPDTAASIELSNVDEQGGVVSTAPVMDAASDSQADKKTEASAAKSEAGTSFSKVGKGGDISAEELATPGSPARYRELVLTKATGANSLNANPAMSRRFLAVDRATYQARLGQ